MARDLRACFGDTKQTKYYRFTKQASYISDVNNGADSYISVLEGSLTHPSSNMWFSGVMLGPTLLALHYLWQVARIFLLRRLTNSRI